MEPKRRGLLFKLTVGLCVALVIFAGWLLLERLRGQAALRNYEQQLRAKGEKLTFSEVTPPVPDGENRAIELANLFFRTGAVLIPNAPPAMRCIAPGKAWVVTRETDWFGEKGRKFSWEQVGEDLERNTETLDELRELVRSPVLRYPLQYRGVSTLLPHLARLKNLAQWLSASALYKIRRGDIKGAVDDIESTLLVTRLTEYEPILISQLVRNAVIAIAVSYCWPLLEADNLTDADLARLQGIFERVDPIGPMVLGLQGERAMGRDTFEMIRSSQINVNDLIDSSRLFEDDESPPHALENLPYGEEMLGAVRLYVIYPIWQFAFSHGDEKHLLEESQAMIDSARASISGKSATLVRSLENRLSDKEKPGGEYRSWRYFVTGLFMPANVKAAGRAFRVKTQCNIAVAAIALRRYQLRHKKYPNNLGELVPEFVSEVPVDYMDGKPLRYRLDGDQFVLWSIGLDGKDDGGAPNSKPSFGWLQGLDDVWPQPASPAEAAKYREEQAKAQ
jgi:hypothetical protein